MSMMPPPSSSAFLSLCGVFTLKPRWSPSIVSSSHVLPGKEGETSMESFSLLLLSSSSSLHTGRPCRTCGGGVVGASGGSGGTSLFSTTPIFRAYHYIHPKSSRPIRQFRRYGDPRYINNEVALIKGLFGLITVDFGMVTHTQMENARLAILRRIPRGAFTLVMRTDYEEFPVVKKSPESRMGAGKSNIHHFAYKFTTGIPLFEIHANGSRRLHQAEAEGIFLAGRPFIPLQTAVVPRGRVDEYQVFK